MLPSCPEEREPTADLCIDPRRLPQTARAPREGAAATADGVDGVGIGETES